MFRQKIYNTSLCPKIVNPRPQHKIHHIVFLDEYQNLLIRDINDLIDHVDSFVEIINMNFDHEFTIRW